MNIKKIDNNEEKNSLKVSIGNKINTAYFPEMSAKDLNLFFGICAKMKDKNDDFVEMTYKEINQLTGVSRYRKNEFERYLGQFSRKLMQIGFIGKTDDDTPFSIVMFPTFMGDNDTELIKIRVNPDLVYLLNNLKKNFTTFLFEDFLSITNKRAKRLFVLLKQFSSTGYVRIKKNKLLKLLQVPDSYRLADFNNKELKLIIKQLYPLFNNLECTIIKHGKEIVEYEFTFSPTKRKSQDSQMETDDEVIALLAKNPYYGEAITK